METEANVPEDESATNFTLIESTTTTTEKGEKKFPQKNGNDLNLKYPLVEEASQANSGKTGEISVTGPKEIYQNSSEANTKSEKNAEQKPEGHNTEVLKNSNAEELVELELIKKSSMPEDRALSTLPNIASIQVERIHESIRDEIQKEFKSTVTNNKEQQESEKDVAEKEEVLEGFDLHEVTRKGCTENEKKDESQLEAQCLETKDTKNSNFEKETTEVKSSNDTNEHEKVWESHLGERININDGGKFIKEEVKEMEEVTNIQLMETTRESILDNEAPILSTSAFVKGETNDEIFQKQTLKEEESATKEDESCGPESKLEQATKAVEAIDPPEIMSNCSGGNEEQTDHRSEAPISQSEITKHSILEGFMTKESSTKSSYDIEESGEIPDSHTIENSKINDGEKSLLEETVYIKEPMDVELQKSETESAPEDKTPSALLTTICHTEETLEESTQEEIHKEVESTVASTKEELASENDFKKKMSEDFDLHKVTGENEKKEESQFEAQSQETTIIKHQNLGVSAEINPGVPEDKARSILPSTASVKVETIEEHIQEEILKEGESTDIDAKDTKEGLRPENYFEENKNVLEAFELQETTTENEKKDDLQWEVQSLQTKDIKHPNLEGEATETKPYNDSDINEEVSASPIRDKLEIKEGGNRTQKEAKVMEEATDKQLLETAIESFDDEGPSILPTLSIVKGETVEETFLLQARKDEKPVATDNNGLCTPENNLEQTTKVFEDFDTHETMGKLGAKNEEHADKESQPSQLESAITKNTNSEGMMTTKDNTKMSNEVEENEIITWSHSVENSEIKDSSKTLPEQTISMKEDVDSSKFETEGLPENKAPSTLPTAESIGVETVMQSIQEEIHKEEESTVINTKEGQKPEDNFEKQNEVPETFELHEAQGNMPPSEAPSLQTIAIKHLDLGDATETKTCKYYKENEQLPTSQTSEKLEIKDGGKFISEGEKEKEEAIETQLHESTKEITGDDETPSTFPTSVMAKGEVDDQVFQEQTFTEEESTTIEKDESSRLENEREETTKLEEAIDLTETKSIVGVENEEQADHQSKVPSPETQKTKHANSEGTVTMESRTTNYEVEQENIHDSHSLDNLENKDCITYVELQKSEVESLPEDQAMSTLSTTTSVGVETVEESIQEVHKEEKSEVTKIKVGQRPESDFEEEKKVPENLDLHKTDNTCVETQMNYEVQSLENTTTEHLDSEADTREITTSNNKQENEVILALQTSEKFEINDNGEFTLEEGKGLEEGIEVQLEKYEKEMTGVPDDEALSTLPTSAMVKDETTDETIHKLTFKKEDSEVVHTNGSFEQENEHDETTKEIEKLDIPKTMGKVDEYEEKEQYAGYQSEFPILENPITQHTNSNEIVTVEGSTKTTYDVDEQKKIPELHFAEKSDVNDSGKTLSEEAIYFKEATYVELPKSQTENVPEDKAQSTVLTTTSFNVETIEEIIQQQTLHEEASTTNIDESSKTENELEQPTEVYGENDLPETMGKVQSETPTSEITIMRDTISEGLVATEISTESSDDGEYLVVSEDKAMSILPSKASAGVDIVEEIIQQEIHEEEESAAIDTKVRHIPKNYLVDKEEVFEAVDLHKTTTENEPHPVVQRKETMVIVRPNLEGENRETKLGYDIDDLKQVLVSLTEEKSEIKNEWRFVQAGAKAMEEASDILLDSTKQNVREDKTLSTFLTTASVEVKSSEESIQAEIHQQMESAVPEIDYEKRTKNSEASHLHEATLEYKKIHELHFEEHNQETIVIENTNLEGDITETNPHNDTEESEQVLASNTEEKLVMKDGEKIIHEEAKVIKETNVMQLPEFAEESIPGDKASSTIVKGERVEDIIHEQTLKEEKSISLDNDGISCRLEKEVEQAAKFIESIDLPEIMGNVGDENKESAYYQSKVCTLETAIKEHPGHQSRAFTHDTAISKHTIAEELEAIETNKESSYNLEDTEQKLEPHSTSSINVESIEQSIHEKIHIEAESALADTKEMWKPENDFTEKKTVVEDTDPYEAVAEYVKKDELQYEAQSTTSMFLKHPNIGSTTETNLSNAIEELQQVPVSDSTENLEIKEGGKYTEKEAGKIEDATGVVDDESLSTLAKYKIVKSETVDESVQEQSFIEETLTTIDNQWSCRPENVLEQTVKVVEEINLPGTKINFGEEIDQDGSHQSEAPALEIVITKHEIIEGLKTMEIHTKSSYDVEELENIPESHYVENSKIQDGVKIVPVEVIDINEATDAESAKSKIESMLESKMLLTLPTTTLVGVETIEESTQEAIHDESELTVTYINESRRTKYDFEEKKTIHKAFDLHKATTENEKNDEAQFEVQRLETILIKHAALEGGTRETKPSGDIEEQEQGPVSYTVEKSEMQDVGKSILEEEKGMDEENDIQLDESAKGSMPGDEAPSMLPKSAIVKAEGLEEIFREKIIEKEESATIEYGSSRPENELEQTPKIVEAIDLPETTDKINVENEEHAKKKTKSLTMETTIRSYTTSVGLVKMASSTESSYEVDALERIPESSEGLVKMLSNTEISYELEVIEKIPESSEGLVKMASSTESGYEVDSLEKIHESQSVENSKIEDCGETPTKETTNVQLSKYETEIGVPEDKLVSTLPTTAFVGAETFEESTQENIHMGDKSALTQTREWQKQDNGLNENKNVPEAFDQHQDTSNTSAEKEKKDKPQSEVQTEQTTITEFERETTNKRTNSYIEEHEMVPPSHTSPEEEATYIKKAASVELAELEIESVLEEKSLSTLLTTETVRAETIEESTQINIQKVTESTVTNTNEEHRLEKDFEEKKVPQAFDAHRVTSNTNAEKKNKVEPLSEVQSPETIVVKHPNMEQKTIETNPNNYTKELGTVPSSSIEEILDMKDGGKSIQEEASVIKEATGMELLVTTPASIPEALPTILRSAIVKGETIDEIFVDHTLKEEETTAIDNKKGCRPENQLEQTTPVVEAIDLIETMDKVSPQNTNHAYFLSEALTLENGVPKHTISEGTLTTESITKSSYYVEKLEKVPKKQHEEATNVELHEPEAESVPKDKAQSTTNSIFVRVETIEECIKQEIHKEAKSTVTYDKEGKIQENIFEEKEEVLEAFDLQEETDNTRVEHENNAETQPEEHSVETMLIKLPNFDGLESKNISLNENTVELEKCLASHYGEKLEMEEEERDAHLAKSKIEIAAKLDAYEQSDVRESAMMDKSELPAEKISLPEVPYPSKKVESYPDYEVHDLIKEKLPETKEIGYNIQDHISKSDDHIQGQIPLCEDRIKPEPQIEVEQHLNVPLSAKETSVVGLITKEVHDGVDMAGAIENIEYEHTIDYGNSLAEAQISSTTEETINQVKGEITKNYKATDLDDDDDEQNTKADLSIENDPTEKEAATYKDKDEVIESPKEDEVGDEFEKISPSSSGDTVMIKGSRDINVKVAPHKKSHSILSGVGSKVKHSISKVKKAITGKSSHPKT